MISKQAVKSLLNWKLISFRLINCCMFLDHTWQNQGQNHSVMHLTLNLLEKSIKEEFYNTLQSLTSKQGKKKVTIVMGDLNAKKGSENEGYESVIEKYGLGEMNENSQLFAD